MGQVNWSQVFVLVFLIGLLVVLAGARLLAKFEAMHERARVELMAAHQAFLQSDYARLAGESHLFRAEIVGLIGEVRQMAVALKDAMDVEGWDPDDRLDRLAQLSADIQPVGRHTAP